VNEDAEIVVQAISAITSVDAIAGVCKKRLIFI
jgi:hypothetical protein